MVHNFPNLTKNINPYIQETQYISNRIKSKKSPLRNITVKLLIAEGKKMNLESSKKEATHHTHEILNKIN